VTQPAQLPHNLQEVVCFDDLDLFGRETRSDLEALVQDVYHMLIEELGSNLDVPDRGIGIYSLLSGSNIDVRAIAQRIDQQLPRDPRIDASSTSVEVGADGGYTLRIQIQAAGSVVGLAFAFASAAGLSLISWGAS